MDISIFQQACELGRARYNAGFARDFTWRVFLVCASRWGLSA